MQLLKPYVSFMERLNKWMLIFVGILLGVMTLFICTQVFYRYALNQSLSWTEEATKYISIWSVFLGASIAAGRRELISVEAIMQLIPEKIEKAFRVMVLFFSIVFCLYLIIYGFSMVQEVAVQRSTALRLPMWIPYAAIPVGGFLILLNLFSVLIRTFQVEERGE
ncbi:TRAP transporter small permease [Alkalihalobacillus oceani]|uniref:TRAP transporter small permease n=1 Tax=Halalkalibacter oceani TaxID=1653776 RepID=UPI0020416775|nr:TRAP transporter small permease [Halalkalibacter oceani]MCM3760393.1 TRAP transporter small permease [Halalkalibacter oceani]